MIKEELGCVSEAWADIEGVGLGNNGPPGISQVAIGTSEAWSPIASRGRSVRPSMKYVTEKGPPLTEFS